MKIIDDFLSDYEWQRVKKVMTSANFSWNMASIVYPDELECDELDNLQYKKDKINILKLEINAEKVMKGLGFSDNDFSSIIT